MWTNLMAFQTCLIISLGLTACRGDSWRDTVRHSTLCPYHAPWAEAPMALVTLQTIFQDAFPAYEQTHPLPPTSAKLHAPSCSAGRRYSEDMSKPVLMAIWCAS